MRRRGFLFLLAVLAAGALGAACDDDDDEDAASRRAAGGAEPASGVADCEPVGTGGTELGVDLDEWSVIPERPSTAPGLVRFVAGNEGDEAHELVVVRAESAEALPVEGGKVVEGDLPAGTFIGEIEAFPAGETCEGSFDLTAGTYVLFCNIVEEEADGEIESHFQQGMHATLQVQ